jgi:hypothetical protein
MKYAIRTKHGTPAGAIAGNLYRSIDKLMAAVRDYSPEATEAYRVVLDGEDGPLIGEIAEVA